MGCERIGVRKLDYYVNNPRAVIIDLRDSSEYKKGHVKQAINVPYKDFDKLFHVNGRNIYINGEKFDMNNIYVCYCKRGATSLMVCSQMSEYGLNVKSVVGGFFHYNGKFLVNNA